MGLFRRNKIAYAAPVGPGTPLAYDVPQGDEVGVEATRGWVPFAPGATPNVQVGAYDHHIPTQIAGYWPDIQLRCGVEGVERHWQVFTASDRPYFLQQPYPQNRDQYTRDGGAPGAVFGAGLVSQLLGPQRQANAEVQSEFQENIGGW